MASEVHIEVLSPKGKRPLNIDSQISVKELRCIVSQELEADTNRCCLIVKGRILNDSQSLQEAGLDTNGARLFVVFEDPEKEKEEMEKKKKELEEAAPPAPFVEQFKKIQRQIERTAEANRVDTPAQSLRHIEEVKRQHMRHLEETRENNEKSLESLRQRKEAKYRVLQPPPKPDLREMQQVLLRMAADPDYRDLMSGEGGGIEGVERQLHLLKQFREQKQQQQRQQQDQNIQGLQDLLSGIVEEPSGEELELKLKQLHEMGYKNEEDNLKALVSNKYNMDATVESLAAPKCSQ